MDEIKEAFTRVKEDINFLKNSIEKLSTNLIESKKNLIDVCDIIQKVNDKQLILEEQNQIINNKINFLSNLEEKSVNHLNIDKKQFSDKPLDKQTDFPTEKEVFETNKTDIQTHQSYINPLKPKFYRISIGNIGVQTNRQTNQQTDIRHNFSSYNQEKSIERKNDTSLMDFKDKNSFTNAENLLDSLDNIKKDIRLKFKRLTDQELIVFSTIYQLEEELGYSDYKSISRKLNLSESSIRDYVRRLIGKGIPLEKIKINNKEIQLSISSNLKKIASLNTILELRDL